MWIKLSKISYVLLVLYFGWFQIVFFQIPHMLMILGIGMIGFILLHAAQTKTGMISSLTSELILWIIFAVTSLVFGLFVAANYGDLIGSITTLIQFLILIFGVLYISNRDGNIDFFINVFIVYSILCAVTTVFWGVDYGSERISMGLSNNPNSLGITMVIGVCCVLFKLNLRRLLYSVILFSVILLFIYVCLLTGSRKSFISVVLLIIYWFLFVSLKDLKALRLTEKLKGIFSIILVVGAGYYIIYPYFSESVLLQRLTQLFESGADTREGMYTVAFHLFKENPITGIGLNNFRAVSGFGTYSHSTYAEALVSTGIIGCIFYFSTYVIILFKYLRMMTSKGMEMLINKKSKVMLGMLFVLLFLGVGIIHFYEMTSSIAFGMLFAFYRVNVKKAK